MHFLCLTEPSHGGLSRVFRIRRALNRPGYHPIRTNQNGAQTQPIPGVTVDTGNATIPARCKPSKRCPRAKVQQQPSARPEQLPEPRCVV